MADEPHSLKMKVSLNAGTSVGSGFDRSQGVFGQSLMKILLAVQRNGICIPKSKSCILTILYRPVRRRHPPLRAESEENWVPLRRSALSGNIFIFIKFFSFTWFLFWQAYLGFFLLCFGVRSPSACSSYSSLNCEAVLCSSSDHHWLHSLPQPAISPYTISRPTQVLFAAQFAVRYKYKDWR